MNKELKHLLEIYKQKRYSKIEDIPINKMLRIDSEEVTKVVKKNHSYLICTCQSSGKTEHSSLCRHKQFFIMFPLLELFKLELEKLIKFYEGQTNISSKISPEVILDDLDKLMGNLN